MKESHFVYRDGFDVEWARPAFQLFNDSGLKRTSLEAVNRGLASSQHVGQLRAHSTHGL